MRKPIKDVETQENTGYFYEIGSNMGKNPSASEFRVNIYKIGSDFELTYSLTSGRILSGKDKATKEEINDVEQWISIYLKAWQEEAGLRYIVQFSDEFECYYDFMNKNLYHAHGKKDNKRIESDCVQFTPKQRAIVEYITEKRNYLCTYGDISQAITGSEDQISAKTLQVHINAIKGYDPQAIKPFIKNVPDGGQAEGGYRYSGNAPRFTMEKVSVRSESREESWISIDEFASLFFHETQLKMVVFCKNEKKLFVMDTEQFPVNMIINFFFPQFLFHDVEENSTVLPDKKEIFLFCQQIKKSVDQEWECCKEHIYGQIAMVFQLQCYRMINGSSDGVPESQQELEKIDAAQFVEKRLEMLINCLSEIVNDRRSINSNFFKGTKIHIEKDNVLDAIAAVSWIGFYRQLVLYVRSIDKELEGMAREFRRMLIEKIHAVFFPPVPETEEEVVQNNIMQAMQRCMILLKGTEQEQLFQEHLEKFYEDLKKFEFAAVDNQNIALSESDNGRKADTQLKSR